MRPMFDRFSRLLAAVLLSSGVAACWGQDRWASMPGFENYRNAQSESRKGRPATFSGRWLNDDQFEYTDAKGSRKVFDFRTMEVVSVNWPSVALDPLPVPQSPARGRQFARVVAPGGKVAAETSGGNVLLIEGEKRTPITTDGGLDRKVKYGSASWVYGEELEQRDAMGFSPDGSKLWFYRFDEREVPIYHLATSQSETYTELETEAYPKPGFPNPEVDLMVYNVATKKTTKIQVRPGAFNEGIGHYVYGITWRADSSELMFHRMNRKQNHRELCAADPASGATRVIDSEKAETGWVEYGPLADFSEQSNRTEAGPPPMRDRMLIMTEASGFYNLDWLDTRVGKRSAVTRLKQDVLRVLRRDAQQGLIWVLAGGEGEPYRQQVWRVRDDGTDAKRLTDPETHHTVNLSSDGSKLMDLAQHGDHPPMLRALDGNGKLLAVLEQETHRSTMPAAKWMKTKSTDGSVDLYFRVSYPLGFEATKKYPVLFDVYGGPLPHLWGSPAETYSLSDVLASAGFLVIDVYPRGGTGRGRAFRQAIYEKLGIIEIDDIAAIARAVGALPYAEKSKFGIHGTSYGGYASAMALLRYPDLFHAASASSMVSDWRNYDTTYTERYMGLLPENREAYEAGSTMNYADQLKGWLMLYYGTSDDNTHPSNTLQLARALQRAGKSFELQAGVDQGHSGLNQSRMMEFFIERLILNPDR